MLLKASKENVILEMSQSAESHILLNDHINFLSSHLTRSEYNEKMSNAKLILLPYDEESYRYRTSVIFVEAIVSGIIPTTTKNTWMASELVKYDLEDLIVDWERPD
ncbi:MAG: hypothetical protein K1060chlam5_01171, partial [Candidatus Anoxychlamydiales bacterium]|nr:hypothetical protein [Candidatus Anoxychlamydiales bacterium]